MIRVCAVQQMVVMALLALGLGLGSTVLNAREASDNFRDYCSLCHGVKGEGGVWRGRKLIGDNTRQLSDTALYQTIEQGRPDRGMPSFATALTNKDISALVVYIGTLQGVERSAPASVSTSEATAPPAAPTLNAPGRHLFENKCIECHSILNEGGRTAPDLTDVELRLSRDQIYTAIADPSAAIVPGYEMREIVTEEGETLRGWSRTDFTPEGSFQLYNPDESLWTTYFIEDLRSHRILLESLMPGDLLDDLTEQEIEDLLAYLLSPKRVAGDTQL
jgi:putative heme-binding domain-containing protein